MSLLDTGREVVLVYVEVETTDELGNKIMTPDFDNPIAVNGRWQSSTAEETADLGQQEQTVYRFISRTFPAGAFGRVDFEGDEWDIIGAPRHRRGSSTTQHFTTYLKKR